MKNGLGKETQKNGTIYEGKYLNNQRMGQGKQTNANGTIYEGAFVNGKLHGKGKIITDTYSYEGMVQNNFAQG